MKFTYLHSVMIAIAMSSSTFIAPVQISAQSAYDAQFLQYPTYAGSDLELSVDDCGTHFRLWSPKASEAIVNIYNDGHTGKPYKQFQCRFIPKMAPGQPLFRNNYMENLHL